MTSTNDEREALRPITEHRCYWKLGDRLAHRHWFYKDELMPTCERCGTPIDREHKETGPVSWEPEKRPEVITVQDRYAISQAAMDALGEWLVWPDAGRDGPREVTVGQTLSFLKGLPNALGYRDPSSLPAPAPADHPDDLAVDQFATAMKAKLAKKRAEGRGGWDDREGCPTERLSDMLRDHVCKGDPLDVGNFAMMLHQRGDRIAPTPQPPATGGADPELIARVEKIASATGKDRWKIANLTGYDWRRILAALANHSPDAGGVGEAERLITIIEQAHDDGEVIEGMLVRNEFREWCLTALRSDPHGKE